MPLLVCSAQSCVYNDGMYCSKGDILVGGEDADAPQDTSCASFHERSGESAKNSMGTPTQSIYVDCEANECKYNKELKCDADKIEIVGAAASQSEQTECGTFDKE